MKKKDTAYTQEYTEDYSTPGKIEKKMLSNLDFEVKYCEDQRDKLVEALLKNYNHGMVYSSGYMESAAKYHVALILINYLNDGMSCDELLINVTDALTFRAMYPSNSTSQSSNRMNEYETAAYAHYRTMLLNLIEMKDDHALRQQLKSEKVTV